MLVLRKEIKIGIGAGLAILGIAGVYGLLASVSSSGPSGDQQAVVTDENGATERGGLPPKEKEEKPVDPTPVKPVELPKLGDPFAESNRTDGNTKNDVWASALTTGRIAGDVRTAGGTTGGGTGGGTLSPTIIKAPTLPRPDSKLVKADTGITDGLPPVDRTAPRIATPPLPAPTPAGSGKYVIANGDTFSTISAKVYGSKKYYAVLVKANPDVNPSRMKVGREIVVPPKESVTSVGGAIEADRGVLAAPIDTNKQYRVAPGDTLSHIASKLYGHSTMWSAIYEANKTAIGPDEAKLKVGTLLDLPQRPVR